MKFRIAIILLAMLAPVSCKHRNLVTSEDGILLELPNNAFSKVSKNLVDFDYLSIKAKSSVTSNNSSQSFILNLKMRKDSFIWMSASAFGFEAVRALITVDSVTLLDRLSKTYYKEDIGYLNKMLGFEVSLRQLQNILIGNPPLADSRYKVANHALYHQHLTATNGNLHSIMLINSGFLINRSRIEQVHSREALDIRYLNHKNTRGAGDIPGDIQAKASNNGKEVVEINLHYSNVNTDKFDYLPISIPRNYEKGS